MTATTDVTIWCDGMKPGVGSELIPCGKWHTGHTADSVRISLRMNLGWITGLKDGRDLCSEHKDQRNETTGHGR